ncbi:MAG: hypothetical protein ACRDLO_15270 [Solirubrobacterales bacterium]
MSARPQSTEIAEQLACCLEELDLRDQRLQLSLFRLLAEGSPVEVEQLAERNSLDVAHGLTPGEIVDGSPGPRHEMRVTDPDGYCLMLAQLDDETVSR